MGCREDVKRQWGGENWDFQFIHWLYLGHFRDKSNIFVLQLIYSVQPVLIYSPSARMHFPFRMQRVSTDASLLYSMLCCYSVDKKLSYRRETARQLPTWRGARPSSPLPLRPLWLHLCVWSNPKATAFVRQACRP